MRTVIKPASKLLDLSTFTELVSYRDLFYILIQRDLRIRYKQTVLGVTWVIFQPLISALIFTLLFGNFINFPSKDIPYIVFAYIGLAYWTFFSNSLTNASNSLVNNEGIIKKIYFPRLIVPTASIMSNIPDFLVSILLLIIILVIYKISITLKFIGLILLNFPVVILTVMGLSFILSSISVKYRDTRFILPFFVQLLLFLTPVFYPLNIVSPNKRWVLALNPLTTVIETARTALSNESQVDLNLFWLISILSMSFWLIVGTILFKKTENYISDVI